MQRNEIPWHRRSHSRIRCEVGVHADDSALAGQPHHGNDKAAWDSETPPSNLVFRCCNQKAIFFHANPVYIRPIMELTMKHWRLGILRMQVHRMTNSYTEGPIRINLHWYTKELSFWARKAQAAWLDYIFTNPLLFRSCSTSDNLDQLTSNDGLTGSVE